MQLSYNYNYKYKFKGKYHTRLRGSTYVSNKLPADSFNKEETTPTILNENIFVVVWSLISSTKQVT